MSREIHEVYLENLPFKVLIYSFSTEDANDKLTYFTREKGLITKDLYHDFLIAHWVSNIGELIQHLKDRESSVERLAKIRQELIDNVIKYNPLMDPDNLVINSNHVVKIKDEGDTDQNIVTLTENEVWGKESAYSLSSTPMEDNLEDEDTQLDLSSIQNTKDLPYKRVQKFWRRFNGYVTIKHYEPGSEVIMLSGKAFTKRASYEQYIITLCIEDVEDLFIQIESSGLNRSPSYQIMHELYELCIQVNPFLDFEFHKDSVLTSSDDSVDPFSGMSKAAQGEKVDFTSPLKSKIKSFREVKKEVLLSLGQCMKEKVIGQDQAVDDVVDAVQRASVGLKDPDQPVGSFIFTGYTGVGKTYAAKILAEELTGTRHNLVTVDCSEYSADHEYAKLIGAPSGYLGHDQGGYLTNAIQKAPFSIVLFDEIEKASDKVHQLLLQIMDEARLTDGRGQQVSFRDAIIVMTSNLGVKETQSISKTVGFGHVADITREKRNEAFKQALKKTFKPEFLNRVTRIINFDTLTRENYFCIIELELAKLQKYLRLNNTPYSKLQLCFDESLYDYIFDLGIDENFGARPLHRTIEREISTPLAQRLLNENIDCDSTAVNISIKDGEIYLDFKDVSSCDNPPFYLQSGGGNE